MSLDKVRKVFMQSSTCSSWSLQLLRIKNTKREGTTYSGREILLSPDGPQHRLWKKSPNVIFLAPKQYQLRVTEYNGATLDKTIYKLSVSSELIATEYDSLITAIADPDKEINPLEFKAQAYLLKGIIFIDGKETPVKLISMQNPVTTLKHKFCRASGTFKEITDKVLSLRTSVDVIIIDDTLYMLTLAGENLFNMESAYKATCASKLENIATYDIVTDFSTFSAIAGSGHNPRKFVSFNDDYLRKLNSATNRRKMALKFSIPMDGDKFDTSKPGASDKLVKLLCNRGMVDPFDDNPMEVVGTKEWK